MWQEQQENAFKEMKQITTVQPVLKYYNLCEEVTLTLGATILQQGQPIVFAYAQIEEFLAIVFGCERFKHTY